MTLTTELISHTHNSSHLLSTLSLDIISWEAFIQKIL